MTTFEFDTASSFDALVYGRINYTEALLDAAKDSLPADAEQDEIDAALAKLIVADLIAPKTAKTVRLHVLRYWPLIASMANTSPASFDFIIEQLAERLGELN